MATDDPTFPDGAVVYIVDDEEAVRDSLSMLLRSVGLTTRSYGDAESFLADHDPTRPSCLICDVRMPGTSGFELQTRMESENRTTPIIFITGHGDVPMAVDAMRRGAVDFIQKPFNDEELLERIHQALNPEQPSTSTDN